MLVDVWADGAERALNVRLNGETGDGYEISRGEGGEEGVERGDL
jgi:hypothetical protein